MKLTRLLFLLIPTTSLAANRNESESQNQDPEDLVVTEAAGDDSNTMATLEDMTTPEQFMADLSAIYDELIDHDDSINATSSLDGELLTVNDTDSQDVVTDHAITERSTTTMINEQSPPLRLAIQPSECNDFQAMGSWFLPDMANISIYSSEMGGNLNITCMSELEHKWESTAAGFDPLAQVHWHGSLADIQTFIATDQLVYHNYNFFSTIQLQNLSFANVGQYKCQSLFSLEEEPLFLFVRDLDHPASFPQSDEPKNVNGEIASPVVLPCVPAHPTFRVDTWNVSLKRRALDLRDRYEYQPHLGFIVPNITDMSTGGEYECVFSSFHVFEDTRLIRLVVEERQGINATGFGFFDQDDSAATWPLVSRPMFALLSLHILVRLFLLD